MQKRIKACVIIASLLFLVLFLNYDRIAMMQGTNVAGVSIVSTQEIPDLLENKKETTGNHTALCYDDMIPAYDAQTNTIYIPQNLSDDYWKGKLQPLKGGEKLYFAEDDYFENKQEAIASGHAFELYYVSENEYSVFRVVFSGMPIMKISTSEQVSTETGTVWLGDVWVYDQYRTAGKVQQAECEYRVRGGSSYNYEKPGYKVKLTDKKLSFLGMREDDDWILNALYDDAGLIHNKLSYSVWHEIASYNQVPDDDGINMEYIEVFRDNEYIGVYALTERIDKKTLSLDDNDILYKCRADRIPEEHNYTNEMTDGMRPVFILKYPQEPAGEDWDPIKKWVNYYCKEQFESYEEGESLLNMENAIDYNIFILLICGSDNTRKNSFLVAEYQSEGEYEFIKVPWDMNATWGNPWVDDEKCNYTIYDPAYIEDVNMWYTDISTLYFYDESKVADLLRSRWKELRERNVITKEKLYEMLNGEFSYLHKSGAYARNYQKWTHGAEYWKDDYIYEYADGRIDFLDTYFEQLYMDATQEAIYDHVDYSQEFDVRYYWTKHYETLSELYPYDRDALLEHYVLYGKPYGLDAKKIYEK